MAGFWRESCWRESATADFSGAVLHHPIQIPIVHHGDVELHVALADVRIGSLVQPLVNLGMAIGDLIF